jgi:hypothetical protein
VERIMSSKAPDRSNPCFKFLRRLQGGGRSNMYGAIPYLITEFGCTREDAFRIVCDWLDQQTAVPAGAAEAPSPRSGRKIPAKPTRGRAA